MELLNRIKEDFMTAYKNKDMDLKNYLGFLKSEVTKESKTPDDAYILGKFKAMRKNGVESGSLNELEMEVLNGYIPEQMSRETLTDVISNFLTTENISGMKSMGRVMGYLKAEHAGMYDGRMASELAKELLK